MENNELLQAIALMIDSKLDEKFATITSDISELKRGQQSMQGNISELNHGQQSLQENMSKLNQRVINIEMVQENVTNKNIQLLVEGHKGLTEKLSRIDKLVDDVEEIKGAIVAVEAVTANNWNNIIELKKAKA